MKISYSYLDRQFADPDPILADIKKLVQSGDFTLGKELQKFEKSFAEVIGARYAIGVGSGTDALFLPLKALGIGAGDEVITAANTFVATVGAIETAGARTVFVDCNDKYVMDVNQVEKAITKKTKAILPVHFAGQPVDMPALMEIANRHNLHVVEDACQAIDSSINGKRCGTWGVAAGFSLHPLKNLNVWGDGGVVTTNSDEMRDKLHLIRNHGMINRDEYACYAYNSRLDTLQAVVGNHLIKDMKWITDKRIENALLIDKGIADLGEYIRAPKRESNERCVFHLYMLIAKNRDELLKHLVSSGIEAKVHYPIPLHLQPASKHLNYKKGDFPVAEFQAKNIITLPVHQHLEANEVQYMVQKIREFYKK